MAPAAVESCQRKNCHCSPTAGSGIVQYLAVLSLNLANHFDRHHPDIPKAQRLREARVVGSRGLGKKQTPAFNQPLIETFWAEEMGTGHYNPSRSPSPTQKGKRKGRKGGGGGRKKGMREESHAKSNEGKRKGKRKETRGEC